MEKVSLDKVINEINKKHGTDTMGKSEEIPLTGGDFVSSGSPYIDWSMGGKGFPLGRIVELYGNPSSGKTLVALRAIAEMQKNKKKCVFIDAENTFSVDFAQRMGVNTKELVVTQMSTGEDVFDLICDLMSTDVSCIVVDSVAALVPQFEQNEDMEKMTIGLHARLMSKGLRKVVPLAAKNNTLVIFINQIREKIGAYGNPETTTGGRALAFYSSVRMEVRRGDFLTEGKTNIGQEMKFKVTKSKQCPPFRTGVINFFYPDGDNVVFDYANELVSMLLIHSKIQQRGPMYYVLEESFKGRKAIEERIKEDKKFAKDLLSLI